MIIRHLASAGRPLPDSEGTTQQWWFTNPTRSAPIRVERDNNCKDEEKEVSGVESTSSTGDGTEETEGSEKTSSSNVADKNNKEIDEVKYLLLGIFGTCFIVLAALAVKVY